MEPEKDGYLDVENPSTEEIIARLPLSTAAAVNEAIAVAKEAFPAWAATPVSRRVEPLFKLAAMIRDNEETLARGIAEEIRSPTPGPRSSAPWRTRRSPAGCRSSSRATR